MDVLRSPAISSVIFVGWMMAAQKIYIDLLGAVPPESVTGFIGQIFATPEGHKLIIVGCVVGFFFAIISLAVSVISFPLLLDRNVGIMTAVATSIRAVVANPVPMAVWGLIVAGTLIIGAVPFLVGLAVAIPLLAYATVASVSQDYRALSLNGSRRQ